MAYPFFTLFDDLKNYLARLAFSQDLINSHIFEEAPIKEKVHVRVKVVLQYFFLKGQLPRIAEFKID
jgi:hypothetical protein